MTGPEHYREAERLLTSSVEDIAAAQVHATLALAAATAYPAVKAYVGEEQGLWSEQREWANVTAPKRQAEAS